GVSGNKALRHRALLDRSSRPYRSAASERGGRDSTQRRNRIGLGCCAHGTDLIIAYTRAAAGRGHSEDVARCPRDDTGPAASRAAYRPSGTNGRSAGTPTSSARAATLRAI